MNPSNWLEELDTTAGFIGMVHLLPLPGSPGWNGSINEVIDVARADAQALVEGGCDAIIVENMGDVPYLKGHVYPETVASMSIATKAVADFGLPVGVQVLAGANREALGIALASGASFLRVESFAYGHVADEGWLEACAGELLRHRANLSAQHISIWADVQKKHAAHAVTRDLSLEELAKGHGFCGADVLIVTGASTGEETSTQDIQEAKKSGLPVAVGSGVTPENAQEIAAFADALIIGSYLKKDGYWKNRVDIERVRRIKEKLS